MVLSLSKVDTTRVLGLTRRSTCLALVGWPCLGVGGLRRQLEGAHVHLFPSLGLVPGHGLGGSAFLTVLRSTLKAIQRSHLLLGWVAHPGQFCGTCIGGLQPSPAGPIQPIQSHSYLPLGPLAQNSQPFLLPPPSVFLPRRRFVLLVSHHQLLSLFVLLFYLYLVLAFHSFKAHDHAP